MTQEAWKAETIHDDTSIVISLRNLGLGIIAVFLGYVVYYIFSPEIPRVRTLMLYDACVVALALPIVIAATREKLLPKYAEAASAALLLCTTANILLSSLLRPGLLDLAFIPFLLVATGAIMLSARWLFATSLTILGTAIPIALFTLPSNQSADYFATLFAGCALMYSVFSGRLTSYRRVLELRESDRRLTVSLREALTRAEERYTEKKHTDQRRQELEEQLRQSQKLEAVGVLAGGVAHDMNNVLGVITSIASLANERFADSESLRQDLSDILSAARRGSALTRNLLGFARQGTRIKERFRIETAIESITHLLRRTIPKQVELYVEVSEGLDDIVGDPGQLSHVIMNLCINAVDAMEGRGSIKIRANNLLLDSASASAHDIPEGRHIELCVEDTGSGIAPENLSRVFEPFFSTKNSNERSGLGLSMVYGTVRDHGGVVTIDSTVGVGTKIRILLPSQFRRPASVAPASVRAQPPSNERRTILLVDDEPLLRSAGRRIIKSLGFEPLVAANGAEAVAVFRLHRDSIALVILDVAMPVMGGRDCFFRLRELDEQIPVLVASGFAKHGGVDELLSAGATGFLAKPYDRDQMSSAIHRCLALSGALPPRDVEVRGSRFPKAQS